MKKLLFIGMMCLMSVSAFAKENSNYQQQCTAHYTVVDENGSVIWGPADVTADNCANAVKAARCFYFLSTGDTSVY